MASFAFWQVVHSTPLRPSMSSVIFRRMLSSSTTSTCLGSIVADCTGSSSVSGSPVVSERGNDRRNVVPLPGRLSTSMLPSSTFTRAFVIKSPRPKPSEFISCAARSNGRKTRSNVSSSIPIPVSPTSTYNLPAMYSVWKRIVPDRVNLMAFVSRLSNICSNLSASPLTVISPTFLCRCSNSKARPPALRAYSFDMLSSKLFRRKGTSLRVSLVSLIL